MRRSALAVAFLVLAPAVHAAADGFDVKGWRLGMTRAELVAAEPRFECRPAGDCFLFGGEYGPAAVGVRFAARFVDDRAAVYLVSFPAKSFESVAAALEARHGPPAKRVAGTAQNRLGAVFSDRTLEWRQDGTTLVARERPDTVDASTVTLTSAAAEQALARQADAAARAAAGKL